MSEIGYSDSDHGALTMPDDAHQEFRELCAISMTGDLTEEEWIRLKRHLSRCHACQGVMEQYREVVATAISAMAAEGESGRVEEIVQDTWSTEKAEQVFMELLRDESKSRRSLSLSTSSPSRSAWRHAIAAAIVAASCIASYKAARFQWQRTASPDALARRVSPHLAPQGVTAIAGTARGLAEKNTLEDDSAVLRTEVRHGAEDTVRLKNQVIQLENKLAKRSADLDQSLKDRAEQSRELAEVETNAQSLRAKLNMIGNQASQDTLELLGLRTRIAEMSSSLEAKNNEIAHEQELLERDRDVRNLISARKLYIAEIYDVGESGETQKPFGRIFYTKGQSLIFYGYDLDQQRGLRTDASFQAWGRGVSDGKHNVSLGLLYQDDASKKRWVLKFNDPNTIAQLDAVFVTIEPKGGSPKPTGKPLLFTYLRLDPNHP